MTGDEFPARRPWDLRPPRALDDRIPWLLWEGELERNGRQVTIMPAIWEWDGGQDLYSTWGRSIANAAPAIGAAAAAAAGNPLYAAIGAAIPVVHQTVEDIVGVAGDRPIGMVIESGHDRSFHPQHLVLTYDSALSVINTDYGRGRGVLPMRFADDPRLAGDYTLYILVEQVRLK